MVNIAKNKDESDFLPDIEAYLESIDNNLPVTLQGLDSIVDAVTARTSLNNEAAKIVVRLFFQEIRHALLKNIKVTFRKLGSFQISSPKSGNKIRVFVKFKPSPSLVKDINEQDR